ncbi:hypothetical protein [Trebonia sp.]|uniref:hypothetical protein n=1 Tax=Trebonia sp. TaxID=2767075 RepID=UPI0026258F60|nr:hypothetical protein [Trebonia sp.]
MAGKTLLAAKSAGAVAALAVGCASCGGPAAAGSSHHEATGTLRVTVMYAGGPARPGGGTPTFPVPNAEVQVASSRTSLSSRAGKDGVVTFRLPGGSYLVSSPTCGSRGTVEVTVTAPGAASLTWWCPIS